MMAMAHLPSVRIHGHGTGALRKGLGEFLRTHPVAALLEAEARRQNHHRSGSAKRHGRSGIICGEGQTTSGHCRVIREYVPLKKAGQNFRGLCRFTRKTPSFNVHRANRFITVRMRAGRRRFQFVMEKCAFPESIRIVARNAGLRFRDRRTVA
jgi:hypothetical protein